MEGLSNALTHVAMAIDEINAAIKAELDKTVRQPNAEGVIAGALGHYGVLGAAAGIPLLQPFHEARAHLVEARSRLENQLAIANACNPKPSPVRVLPFEHPKAGE